MVELQATSSNEWVGVLHWADQYEFIRLSLEPEGGAILERPSRFHFQIPIQDLHLIPPDVRFSAGLLHFDGARANGRMAGNVHDMTQRGTFTLQEVKPLEPDRYPRLMGAYRLAPQRELMFSQDKRPNMDLYFFVDGDQVVRLYPIGWHNFLSERGETIAFHLDGQPVAHSLTWQAPDAEPVTAARQAWSHEESLYVPIGDYGLTGTLLLPAGDPPYPAVMLCHHADTHQRDYYRLFAQCFVQQGIAAFIYDKRGWGESTGTALFSQIAQLADDAVAVFRALQRHPTLRAKAIGIWGISNGAWVAALTASQVGQAAFVIGASLAGVTPARQEQIRRVNVARELGASPRAADLINTLWERLFRFYVDGQWDDELETILQQVYADEELQRLPKHPEHGPHLQPVPPGLPIEEIKAEYGRAWLDGGFDPAPIYAGLSCPILCVWGAEDNVVPLQEGLDRMRVALQNSGHSGYDLRVIPEATHKLYVVAPEPAGMLSEVMHTHLHNTFLAPGVRQLMAGWVIRSLDYW